MPAIGLGATVEVDDGASNAMALVPNVWSIETPDDEVGTVESKRLVLTNRTLVKIPGLRDPGEFAFKYEFAADVYSRLAALKGVVHNWRVTLPSDGTTTTRVFTFPGFLKANKVDSVEADGIQTVSASVVLTAGTTVA